MLAHGETPCAESQRSGSTGVPFVRTSRCGPVVGANRGPDDSWICQDRRMEFTATHLLQGNVGFEDCARVVRKLLGDRGRLEQPDDRTLLARSSSRLAY